MKRKLLRSHSKTIPQFFYYHLRIKTFFCQQKLSDVTMMSRTRDERMQLAFTSNKSKAKCLCDCLSHSNSIYFNEEWNNLLFCIKRSFINDVKIFLFLSSFSFRACDYHHKVLDPSPYDHEVIFGWTIICITYVNPCFLKVFEDIKISWIE